MIPLYTQDEFKLSKSKDLLPIQCKQCGNTFYRTKHRIQAMLNPNANATGDCCSPECSRLNSFTIQKIECTNCGKIFNKLPNQIKKFKNHFCTQSCAATYSNTHKSYGTRRSKLERWLEEQLTILYPNLLIEYNQKTTIKSELDIYIPSLNIAFELNGIYHYEPIFGVDKLKKIKNNDDNKFLLCQKSKIDLCIIDTSQQTYVKPKTSQKYLDIITNIINQRLN